MTPDEVILAAQGVCSDYTKAYPTSRRICYLRMSARQREIFALVRTWDPEFYAICATGTLVDGALNLASMEEAAIHPIESLDEVRVASVIEADPEADPPVPEPVVEVGQLVHIVPHFDADAHLPPRATLRSGVLRQVDDDLETAATLHAYYSRRPKAITAEGAGTLELEDPFDALLVWDLARDLIRRTVSLEGATKAPVLEMIGAAEEELLATFRAHVEGYAAARESRF